MLRWMRTLGLPLITVHKAVVIGEQGRDVMPVLSLEPLALSLEHLFHHSSRRCSVKRTPSGSHRTNHFGYEANEYELVFRLGVLPASGVKVYLVNS